MYRDILREKKTSLCVCVYLEMIEKRRKTSKREMEKAAAAVCVETLR